MHPSAAGPQNILLYLQLACECQADPQTPSANEFDLTPSQTVLKQLKTGSSHRAARNLDWNITAFVSPQRRRGARGW